ncbi:MAG: hypothetical protein ACYC69_16470 [Thermodesulfovibrionales bacterium]
MRIYLKKTKEFMKAMMLLFSIAINKRVPKSTENENYILIDAKPGIVTFTATDHRTFITYHPISEVTVIEPGMAMLQAYNFMKFLMAQHNIDIHNNVNGKVYVGKCWTSDEDVSFFPDIPFTPTVPLAIIGADDIKDVIYAASSDPKPTHTIDGLMMDLRNGALVAMNTQRMAIKRLGNKTNLRAVIPQSTAKKLLQIGGRFLVYSHSAIPKYVVEKLKTTRGRKSVEEPIPLLQYVAFKSSEFMVICRALEGNYPNYETLVAGKSWNELITVNRMELIKAVRIARSIKKEDNVDKEKINLYLTDDGLAIFSESWGHSNCRRDEDKQGEAHLLINCTSTCKRLPLGAAINHEYLLDALLHIPTHKATLRLGEPKDIITVLDGNNNITATMTPAATTYATHPSESYFVQTVCWIEERLLKQMDRLYIKRRDAKDLRRKGRLILSCPIEDYIPYFPDEDDIKMEYKGTIIYNTVIDIMGIIYPGWKWTIQHYHWMHADSLKPLPAEDVRTSRIVAYYQQNINRRVDLWGIWGEIGEILTEKQFIQAVTDRSDKFIYMVETARTDGKCIKVTFLKQKESYEEPEEEGNYRELE